MAGRRKYLRKAGTRVVAVKLALETEGFRYRKWGAVQTCKPGDWLVDADGDVYTVDAETFERTYRAVGPGVYEKSAPVWAERADAPGEIRTKEGATRYEAGDYLVYNDPQGRDGWAMPADRFERTYEPAS